jgi:nucleotide-binding universal stress UspA family protein
MFKRILVPVDLSDKSPEAVDAASQLAKANQGELILLHVIETIEHLDFGELQPFYKKLEDRAIAGLDRLSSRAAQYGVPARVETVYGKRAASIIEFAASRRMDLIILNSHRVEPDQPAAGFATISYAVAVLARCPVLLLK